MSNTTHSPTIYRQESFESFRPQIVCSDIVASGTQESCKKKRSKLGHGTIAANSSNSSKPKPGRKPDPGAPKITRPCSECGKQFWSWKALFGHMRCHPERQWRGINPPPNLRRRTSPENPVEDVRAQMTAEDHEVASCLLMLANRSSPVDTHTHAHYITFDRGMPESASAVEEPLTDGDMGGPSGSNCRFECSSCKKVFGSHQALGGHRASHKNVKGCFALARYEKEEGELEADHCNDTRRDGEEKGVEEEGMMLMVLGHKCSICLKVFSSGQALGGHKRCHWEKVDESPTQQSSNSYISREGWGLDLNLPAPVDDNNEEDSSSSSSELALDLRLGI